MEDFDEDFPIGMRVLLIDNDVASLKVLEGSLVECGYAVTSIVDPSSAIQVMNDKDFDLVISDILMPDMYGLQLLDYTNTHMSKPFVLVMNGDDPHLEAKAVLRGACEVLFRPIPMSRLELIWQHVIRNKLFETFQREDFDEEEEAVAMNHIPLERRSKPMKASNEANCIKEEEEVTRTIRSSKPKVSNEAARKKKKLQHQKK